MKTRVQRWGNSLAVRIPKTYAVEAGLVDDATVELRLEKGRLVLELASPAAPKLEELLEGINESNIHGEVDAGSSVGAEVW